ncbi:SbcC/MukB-like Walker B domain-containing protein [Rhodocyclus tenuis]|uniref:Energy-coupling factor transporter ATP-binding protein EcfA2 n=1 Tax=Rhodocyclus tenuis TaxID=1066 RepID=A0A840G5K7_RHOTE|nr:SbcC/MukB-like Walker B domain-containing protein [Rhodocyclus tenuis]MBB4246018.1 energy-coupling factor transporter ATP-binding protein EcfA2 [Rhodocyclus tenuis]
MKYLEKIRVVQFFLFEQQDVPLEEITGIFGPNGSGKSSLLDAVQIAMLGANSRLCALNAQADEQATTRSLRAYCLGQYGESLEHRARDNATTYITLIWRDTETGAPLSMGVCLYASADRDSHDVLGRYILPNVELSLGDHLEVVNGSERPRAWAIFRHHLIERSKVSGQDPLYADSERYIRAAMLALRGSGSAPVPEAFTRAFRFALRMRFDKTVDQIVRNDVLEARPTNIKKFKEVTESFRRLAEMVAQVEAKIADGVRVSFEYDKAADESRRAVTWNALSKMAATQVANEDLQRARLATESAEEAVRVCEDKKAALEFEATEAKTAEERARTQREAHAAHKDYGALQTSIQAAEARVQAKRTEVANSIQLVRRTLDEAAGSGFLEAQASGLQVAVSALDFSKRQVSEGTSTRDEVVTVLRPALKTAQIAFNELFNQGGTLKRALEEARKAEREAKENLARIRSGRAPLSSEAQRLLTELGDHGVHAAPVCDLVRIVDPEWQPVIEAYLKRTMEALLVSSDQERDAFRIYRNLTGSHTVYGAKIALESRQTIGKRFEQGSVADLIDGDNPAAVAYLQRQLGDLRCADSDKDAFSGQRTLTKDGMLVSGGEIERLRPVPPAQFRIGAGSTSQRSAVQGELDRAQRAILELEGQERTLTKLINALQRVAHEETLLKYLGDVWSAMEEAQHEVTSKTELLRGAVDEDYVRLGAEEAEARQQAAEAAERLREVAEEIGGAKTKRTQCETLEAAAKLAVEATYAAATEARQHPAVDKDFEARQWDVLLDKYDTAYAAMVLHAEEQQTACRRRMATAVAAGSRELGIFLQKYREHAPQEIATDWQTAREWLKDLLKQLNETQLAPFKADMDAAYRTSQETFRNDVAIALNNNLDWLHETMERLNAVLRECPTFSNGERYRFRRVARPKLESLLNFVKNVAAYGPTDDLWGGPGELPEEFRTLLEDKIAPGATGVQSPLDDYREFFEFDIEILREDPLTKTPKVVGHLSKRLGPGSGGEHRSPLYVIAGAALASAYRLDRGHKDGLRLMLLDEAFNKMDPTNIIATMRYLEELGLQVLMASPGENLGILTAFLHRYYDILRDVDNNAVMIEGREVKPETRALFREDLPEFNPWIVDQELAAMRRGKAPKPVVAEDI